MYIRVKFELNNRSLRVKKFPNEDRGLTSGILKGGFRGLTPPQK